MLRLLSFIFFSTDLRNICEQTRQSMKKTPILYSKSSTVSINSQKSSFPSQHLCRPRYPPLPLPPSAVQPRTLTASKPSDSSSAAQSGFYCWCVVPTANQKTVSASFVRSVVRPGRVVRFKLTFLLPTKSPKTLSNSPSNPNHRSSLLFSSRLQLQFHPSSAKGSRFVGEGRRGDGEIGRW